MENGTGTGNESGSGQGDGNGVGQETTDPAAPVRVATPRPLKTGSILIFQYIQDGDVERARKWLEDGNDPNVTKPVQDHLWWPIEAAIGNNQPEILKLLLEYGANPDPVETKDQRWSRTIRTAVYVRSPEMLKMLLDYGAKPDYGVASDPDYLVCTEWFRSPGENSVLQAVNDLGSAPGPPNEFSPQRQMEILKLLLAHGADPAWRDTAGNTPLSLAHDQHRQDIISLLEEAIKQRSAPKGP